MNWWVGGGWHCGISLDPESTRLGKQIESRDAGYGSIAGQSDPGRQKAGSSPPRPAIWRAIWPFRSKRATATLDLAEQLALVRTFATPDPGSFRQLWLGA
jgi:hypothetical protein